MIPPHDLDRMRSACVTTRRAYRSRKNYRLNLVERQANLNEKERRLRDQISGEPDQDRKTALERNLARTIDQRSDVERELRNLDQTLLEIENDYNLNQCRVVLGPID